MKRLSKNLSYVTSMTVVLFFGGSLTKAMETTKKSIKSSTTQNENERIAKGATFIYHLGHKEKEYVKDQAEYAPHEAVLGILAYLYKLAYEKLSPKLQNEPAMRISIYPGHRYYDALRIFFTAYQKCASSSKIAPAQTKGAFRICWTDNEPFLGKYRYFHITLGDNGIQIKPDNGHEGMQISQLFYAMVPFVKEQKSDDIKILSEMAAIFTKYFPSKVFSSKTQDLPAIRDMYAYIQKKYAEKTENSKNKELRDCLNEFLDCAARYHLDYLNKRIGTEIILGEKDFYDAYFFNHAPKDIEQISWISVCEAYREFVKLRKKIYEYLNSENGSFKEKKLEIEIKRNIDDFYDLTKKEVLKAIEDRDIRLYIESTLILLKTHCIQAEKGKSLKQELSNPIFEEQYQLENSPSLLDELIKNRQKLDVVLEQEITAFSLKHKNMFCHRLETTTVGNTDFMDVYNKKNADYQLITEVHKLLITSIENLSTFPIARKAMSILARDVLGSLLWQDNNLLDSSSTSIKLPQFKSELLDLFKAMTDASKSHGWISSSSAEGNSVIKKRYKKLVDEEKKVDKQKFDSIIAPLLTVPAFFPDLAGLKSTVDSIYGKCT